MNCLDCGSEAVVGVCTDCGAAVCRGHVVVCAVHLTGMPGRDQPPLEAVARLLRCVECNTAYTAVTA